MAKSNYIVVPFRTVKPIVALRLLKGVAQAGKGHWKTEKKKDVYFTLEVILGYADLNYNRNKERLQFNHTSHGPHVDTEYSIPGLPWSSYTSTYRTENVNAGDLYMLLQNYTKKGLLESATLISPGNDRNWGYKPNHKRMREIEALTRNLINLHLG